MNLFLSTYLFSISVFPGEMSDWKTSIFWSCI